MQIQEQVAGIRSRAAYVLASVDAIKNVSLAPIMTNGALRRLARIIAALTLIVVSTTPRPRAEGVGTLGYVMYGDCGSDGATSGYTPRCPLGLALMHQDGSGQLPLTRDGADAEPAWSPERLQLAFSRSGDVYVMPATGGTLLNLTDHPAHRRPQECPGASCRPRQFGSRRGYQDARSSPQGISIRARSRRCRMRPIKVR